MNLFLSAIQSLTDNINMAIRASLIPTLIGFAIFAAFIMLIRAGGFGGVLDRGVTGSDAVLVFVTVLVCLVTIFVIFAWVAITWHKAVLENVTPGFLPQFRGISLGAYIGRSIVLGLIMVAILIPLGIIFSLFVASGFRVGALDVNGGFSLGGFSLLGTVMSVIAGTLFTFIWVRLASTLPAIAVGRRVPISEGWANTKEISQDILVGSFFLMLLNFALEVIQSLVAPLSSNGFIGLQVLFGWFTVMLGFSFLTKTYERTQPQNNAADIFE